MTKRPDAIVLLLSGASHMGKSFYVRSVISQIDGAAFCQIDKVYTQAAHDAGMTALSSDIEARKQSEKLARKLARDSKWRTPEQGEAFFRSYRNQIQHAISKALEKGKFVVFEGGTLSRAKETGVIAACATKIAGPHAQIRRAHIEAPYGQWVQNRIKRAALSGARTVQIDRISSETYLQELRRARPDSVEGVTDVVVTNIDELNELLRELYTNFTFRKDSVEISKPLNTQPISGRRPLRGYV